jgi:DNA-binding transcriptional LysR family regulator
VLIPHLPEFTARHPLLRIEIVVDDRRQDLISENVDVVLRFGVLADSSAIARRIGAWPLVAVASPSYLDRKGEPSHPADLAAHEFVVAGPAAGRTITFRMGDEEVEARISGNLVITGAEVAINAGVAGLGIVVASLPSVERELGQRTLLRLMPDWSVGEIEAYALVPSGQTPKPAARAFVDFVVSKLGRE